MPASQKPRKKYLGLFGSAGPTEQAMPKLGNVSNFEMLISKLKGYAREALARPAYKKQPGDGVRRAEARLAAKRKANESIPTPDGTSRQVARRSLLLKGRQMMTVAKREAMSRKIMGGGAIIRRPVDVSRILG